jgi:hypothetical protein
MKDGSFITARFIIKGPQYYAIAVRSKNAKKDFNEYFNSFRFTQYKYSGNKLYTDSFMHFTVATPVKPELNNDYRTTLEKVTKEIAGSKAYSTYRSYWPKSRNAIFKSDSTGELVSISIQQYPQYYYVKDSAKFWIKELNDYVEKNGLFIYRKDSFLLSGDVRGFKFILRDSASSRTIERMSVLKDNYMFSLVTMGDTIHQQNDFINSFFASFNPQRQTLGRDIFKNCLDSFFTDLFSKDSLTHLRAQKSISDVYFGENGVAKIMNALQKIAPADNDYFETKAKLIAELGYINDSVKRVVVYHLKNLYEQTADTAIFQKEVMKALARHKTTAAIKLFKELVLQDPPVFEDQYNYTDLFNALQDSLALAATLYPELLQLTSLSDYKEPVISMLVTLVDSGYVKAEQYKTNYNKIYLDAKIALKKQQIKDEKKTADKKGVDNDDSYGGQVKISDDDSEANALKDYAVLLLPFYDSNINVPKFFDRLLKSKEDDICMNTAVLLLRSNRAVPEEVLIALAANDHTRGMLFTKLEKIKRLDKFPAKYNTQMDLAKSYLLADRNYATIDSLIFVAKEPASYDGKKGTVYFFKYRIKREDDWKMGISGLQPTDVKAVSSDDKLCFMTDKKIRADKPEMEQFQEQLKKILFASHKSAKEFFESDRNGYRYKNIEEYQD